MNFFLPKKKTRKKNTHSDMWNIWITVGQTNKQKKTKPNKTKKS